ncbi:MAG: hypothetical protein NVSMB9_32980 [Isosphaeraceae bacterium]
MNLMLTTLRTISEETEKYGAVAELVERSQAGDREAFGLLVEQFQQTVHAICARRLNHPSEAQELTQEVFLHVMSRIGQLREPERFAGWLRQVAVRMAINRATRRTPPPSAETRLLEGASEPRIDPLNELISRERARRLHEGLARLRSLDRETLVAFYIQGQSLVQMASGWNAPLGTIKRRLHMARKRLRAELEAAVVDAEEWFDGRIPSEEEEAEDGRVRAREVCSAGR